MKNLKALLIIAVLLLLLITLLIYGRPIITPLVFAFFFTLMLAPICGWLESKKIGSIFSITLCFLMVLIPIGLVASFFSVQLYDIIQTLPSIRQDLESGLTQALGWVQQRFGVTEAESQEWLRQNVSKSVDNVLNFLGSGLSSSGAVLSNFVLIFVYTALFLYYRRAFRQFFIMQFEKSRQRRIEEIIHKVQNIVKSYFFGLLLVILILGILNTLGLWLIGIQYAPLWGSLAAMLAIIPYIGTTLGGTLPFLYALVTTGTFWQPAAVVILYFGIQQLEGNFITPKVVGSTIKLNPLVVIFSMFLGGFLWGIPGLILTLPTVAIIRILFSVNRPLKPVAYLMDNHVRKNADKFLGELNHEQYRLTSLFKSKKSN
jgi:predicted PurR-regulated permease PerM